MLSFKRISFLLIAASFLCAGTTLIAKDYLVEKDGRRAIVSRTPTGFKLAVGGASIDFTDQTFAAGDPVFIRKTPTSPQELVMTIPDNMRFTPNISDQEFLSHLSKLGRVQELPEASSRALGRNIPLGTNKNPSAKAAIAATQQTRRAAAVQAALRNKGARGPVARRAVRPPLAKNRPGVAKGARVVPVRKNLGARPALRARVARPILDKRARVAPVRRNLGVRPALRAKVARPVIAKRARVVPVRKNLGARPALRARVARPVLDKRARVAPVRRNLGVRPALKARPVVQQRALRGRPNPVEMRANRRAPAAVERSNVYSIHNSELPSSLGGTSPKMFKGTYEEIVETLNFIKNSEGRATLTTTGQLVPVGTADELRSIFHRKYPDKTFN